MKESREDVDGLGTTLTDHREYLQALHILYKEADGKASIEKKHLSVVKAKLTNMHLSPQETTILTEALDVIIDNNLSFEELDYDKEFLTYAKTITERIMHENYFIYYIQQHLKRLDTIANKLESA